MGGCASKPKDLNGDRPIDKKPKPAKLEANTKTREINEKEKPLAKLLEPKTEEPESEELVVKERADVVAPKVTEETLDNLKVEEAIVARSKITEEEVNSDVAPKVTEEVAVIPTQITEEVAGVEEVVVVVPTEEVTEVIAPEVEENVVSEVDEEVVAAIKIIEKEEPKEEVEIRTEEKPTEDKEQVVAQ